MKTKIIMLLLLAISGWNWPTHQDIVESSYYKMPYDLRSKLNLTLLKEGSIIPDKTFHDNRLHHYPPSHNLTLKWLNKALKDLNSNNSNSASLAIGIASHYISDSYSAPHYVRKEPYKLHSLYEKQAQLNNTLLTCYKTKLSIKDFLLQGTEQGSTWFSWLENKNPKLPISSALSSAHANNLILQKYFNYNCIEQETQITKSFISLSPKILITIIICILLILIIILI